jgi:predicted AlkP superfamily phosphohydrolase/phosphomutase
VTDIVSIISPGLDHNVLSYPYLLGCDIFVSLLLKKGFFSVTPLSSSARQTKAVWNIVSDYNRKAGVVGWWGSFPPEEINGVVVSDHASMTKVEMRQAKGQLSSENALPADQTGLPVYPAALMSELAPFADSSKSMTLQELHYFIEGDSADLERINNLTGWDREERESVIKISYLTDKFFRLTTEHLLDSQDFDLMMTYFFETDAMGHWLWMFREPEYFPELPPKAIERFGSAIDSAYVNIDRILGSIMEHLPKDCHVIVISDHGFGVEDYGAFRAVGHKMAPDGILMMRGPYIKSSANMESKASLEDITPTILTLLGIPIGEDMEGRVLKEAFEDEFWRQYPLRAIPSHDRGERFRARATISGEDDLLKEKLRALGYIE